MGTLFKILFRTLAFRQCKELGSRYEPPTPQAVRETAKNLMAFASLLNSYANGENTLMDLVYFFLQGKDSPSFHPTKEYIISHYDYSAKRRRKQRRRRRLFRRRIHHCWRAFKITLRKWWDEGIILLVLATLFASIL